jgi:hypothetical protein
MVGQAESMPTVEQAGVGRLVKIAHLSAILRLIAAPFVGDSCSFGSAMHYVFDSWYPGHYSEFVSVVERVA